MNLLDKFLNNITMYRLVFYCLLALSGIAIVMSFFGFFAFTPWQILASTVFLGIVCWLTNTLFATSLKAPTNLESAYITALILSLIINPAKNINDYIFLGCAAVIAMASKYILAIHKKHVFNPVALAVVVTWLIGIGSPSWWVGRTAMLPAVVIVAILVIRKLDRTSMAISFVVSLVLTTVLLNLRSGTDIISTLRQTLVNTPWVFFMAIMFTEPLTTPPTRMWRILYGVVVGIAFTPQVHIGEFYTTPELSLLIGNIFSYLVSPKYKWLLKLQKKIQMAPDTDEYIFASDSKIEFKPGQYLELTLPQPRPDMRGSRRFFTIASSPTENTIRFGVKFVSHGSSFKKQLSQIPVGASLLAGQLAGDFLLPTDQTQKLVFLAGGIGITPFRSMVKYLLDSKLTPDIVLLYSNKNAKEEVYRDIFAKARWLRTIYVATETQGRITPEFIQKEIPDYKQRRFYLSGPHSLVKAFEENLENLGVPRQNIVTDFFPGYT